MFFQEKHNIIRLFANQQHAEEHSECQKQSILLNKKSGMINNEYKKYLAYENHNSFGYITSDIYATKLFELYQDDPKTILMFVKRIIEGEKSIKELLTFYNVSLNNPGLLRWESPAPWSDEVPEKRSDKTDNGNYKRR